ncbi:helix-turn-helix transcriptional regulator [Achromobacter kerstersii]|uniref:helix-turn-helix transcriptional regulator n=1 Tax=Achromobacter kerstersii TaxID=1353890 RepID=UPI001C2EC78A|nr:helix-turn-helix domain-containing protein [Achromobacter kerstersii]
MQHLFSPQTLAAYIGLAEQTIYSRHSLGGDIPRAIKLGHLLRFRPSGVESWLDAKRQPKATAAPLQPLASLLRQERFDQCLENTHGNPSLFAPK